MLAGLQCRILLYFRMHFDAVAEPAAVLHGPTGQFNVYATPTELISMSQIIDSVCDGYGALITSVRYISYVGLENSLF